MTPRRKRSLKRAAAGTAAAALIATACAWTHAKLDIYALIVNTVENLPLASTITFKSPVNFTAAVSGTGLTPALSSRVKVLDGVATNLTIRDMYGQTVFYTDPDGLLGVRFPSNGLDAVYITHSGLLRLRSKNAARIDISDSDCVLYDNASVSVDWLNHTLAETWTPAVASSYDFGNNTYPWRTGVFNYVMGRTAFNAAGKLGKTKTISWISTNGVVWVQTITGGIITGISSNGVAL